MKRSLKLTAHSSLPLSGGLAITPPQGMNFAWSSFYSEDDEYREVGAEEQWGRGGIFGACGVWRSVFGERSGVQEVIA